MGGGLLQLSAYGSENEYLNGNPQISFFKTVYKRYTNFAIQNINVELLGAEQLNFDTSIKVKTKIPRNADLIKSVFLQVNLPNIISSEENNFYWVKGIGLAMLNDIDIYIGGQLIERIDGKYIWNYNNLNLSEEKAFIFNQLIGNDIDLSYRASYDGTYYGYNSTKFVNKNQLTKNYQTRPSILGRILNIPIPFWFTKNIGLALPLIALQYHDIEITINFKPARDLYTIQKKDKRYYYYKNGNHYTNLLNNDKNSDFCSNSCSYETETCTSDSCSCETDSCFSEISNKSQRDNININSIFDEKKAQLISDKDSNFNNLIDELNDKEEIRYNYLEEKINTSSNIDNSINSEQFSYMSKKKKNKTNLLNSMFEKKFEEYVKINLDNKFISEIRGNAFKKNNLGSFYTYVRKKANLNNKDEHISNFIYGSYQDKTWSLEASLNIEYIFLDDEERKQFARCSHEYLIEQSIKIDKLDIQHNSHITFDELYHPVKEIIFTFQRNDSFKRNEWLNDTILEYNGERLRKDYQFYLQNSWWFNCCETAKNNPIEINFDNEKILCDRYQELLFRFGPSGEAGDKTAGILGFNIEDTETLYTLQEIKKLANFWLFTPKSEIPMIDNTNIRTYSKNPLIDLGIKINGLVREEVKSSIFFTNIQPYLYNKRIPEYPIYIYSFSINPETYQPMGTCNFSRINTLTFDLNLIETPINNKKPILGKNISRDYEFNGQFYFINYNILKIMGGMGGLKFTN